MDAAMAKKVIEYRKCELEKQVAIHGVHIALFTMLCLQCKRLYGQEDLVLLDHKTKTTELLQKFITSGPYFANALRDIVFLETQLEKHMSTNDG
jgi:hypothetical protein